jgi:hypothetical protein
MINDGYSQSPPKGAGRKVRDSPLIDGSVFKRSSRLKRSQLVNRREIALDWSTYDLGGRVQVER